MIRRILSPSLRNNPGIVASGDSIIIDESAKSDDNFFMFQTKQEERKSYDKQKFSDFFNQYGDKIEDLFDAIKSKNSKFNAEQKLCIKYFRSYIKSMDYSYPRFEESKLHLLISITKKFSREIDAN